MRNVLKLFSLFPKKLKSQAILIVLFTLISSALEIISISSIFPLITLMIEASSAEKSSFYNLIFKFYENLGINFTIKNIIIVFSTFFLVKIFFNIFNLNYQEKYGWKIYQFVSNTLLKIYMLKDYSFFLKNNSSILMRNILNESAGIRATVFVPLLSFVSEIIILMSIMFMLLFLNFSITLKLIFFFIVISIVYKLLTKNFFINLGKKRIYYSEYQFKIVPKIFSLIKEIKILKKENQFYKVFSEINDKYSNYNRIFTVTNLFPRSIIEVLIIGAFLYFVLGNSNQDYNNIFPYLAVYLGAAYRVLPSFVKIINNIRSFDFSSKPMEIFTKEFFDKNYRKNLINGENTLKKLTFNNKIHIKNISFEYDQNGQKIFENFNLEIRKNEFIGFKGKSGKGKSTLANIICGLIKPQKGTIYVDQTNIFENMDAWQKNINIVQQDSILVDDTIKNNITLSFFGERIDEKILENSIKKSDIKNFIENLEHGINTEVGEKGLKLSGGQKQRISFARALYSNPDLLILDEITSALDKDTEKKILETLKELKGSKTMIIISHKDEPLKICDRIIDL